MRNTALPSWLGWGNDDDDDDDDAGSLGRRTRGAGCLALAPALLPAACCPPAWGPAAVGRIGTEGQTDPWQPAPAQPGQHERVAMLPAQDGPESEWRGWSGRVLGLLL